MRSSTFFASLIVAGSLAAFAQVACSSDDSAAPPPAGPVPVVIPDSGTYVQGDADSLRTIVIQGAGSVFASTTGDAAPAAVSCTSDGTTTSGNCNAEFQDTLYATAADGWLFDHWDPSASTVSTFYVDESTPASITAVFVADKIKQPDAGPPKDSGPAPDTGTPDTGAPDTGAPDTGTPDSGHD